MEPNNLWAALQTRYEQQKVVILSEANQEWNHLRLQDYKSIADYNHVIHKICAKFIFCEKEPSKGEKIEKALHTMLSLDSILQHQYRANNYQNYLDLNNDLLQAEKHDELTLKNCHQHLVGTTPLREVHFNVKGKRKG
jgi:membrane-anchored protein YejM (alkaline phosphatase superfamily)